MSAASERVERYLATLAARRGNVEAEVWEQGLRAGARFHFASNPEREYEIEVSAAGGVDREEEVTSTTLTPVDRP